MAIEEQELSERSRIDHLSQLFEGRLPAPLMPDAEHFSGLAARLDDPLRAGAGHGQRLLAEEVLAGRDDAERLLLVQRMRGREHHAFDRRIGERLVEGRIERELVRLPEFLDIRRRLRVDAVEHVETRALVEARDDLLAPPAQARPLPLSSDFLLLTQPARAGVDI